jgi:hypothetical protein
MPKLRRAISINELYSIKRNIMKFDSEWLKHIGQPEKTGSWIIYGHSGNGKTSYATQMAKMLTFYGDVWYNGLEEGASESFKMACKRVGMETRRNKFKLITDTVDELTIRLKKRNSADYIFIDSLQYSGITYQEYKALKEEFSNKLFIFISHAEGKKPEGRIAKKIEYDAFVKIWVEGFKAFPKSRYGGTEPFTIYEKRAAEYWAEIM